MSRVRQDIFVYVCVCDMISRNKITYITYILSSRRCKGSLKLSRKNNTQRLFRLHCTRLSRESKKFYSVQRNEATAVLRISFNSHEECGNLRTEWKVPRERERERAIFCYTNAGCYIRRVNRVPTVYHFRRGLLQNNSTVQLSATMTFFRACFI